MSSCASAGCSVRDDAPQYCEATKLMCASPSLPVAEGRRSSSSPPPAAACSAGKLLTPSSCMAYRPVATPDCSGARPSCSWDSDALGAPPSSTSFLASSKRPAKSSAVAPSWPSSVNSSSPCCCTQVAASVMSQPSDLVPVTPSGPLSDICLATSAKSSHVQV